jgi:hypothetical protein
MAGFYENLADVASSLLTQFGRTVTFRRLNKNTLDDAAKPWRGTATPRASVDASVDGQAVSVSPSAASRLGITTEDSDLIKRSQEILIVALGSTSTDDLATFDEVLDGTKLWKISAVETLKPANLTLLYFVGVRR